MQKPTITPDSPNEPRSTGRTIFEIPGGFPVLTLAFTLLCSSFALAQNESLGDRVWIDLNENGQQESGEPGLPGVQVQLLSSFSLPLLDLLGDPIITTTDANGNYTLLTPNTGNFKLQIIPPSGFTTAPSNAAPDDLDNDFYSNFRTSTVNVSPGEIDPNVDAGLRPRDAAFSETVFSDLNGDGLHNPGEPGLPGITVRLLDSGGSTELATVVTDLDGIYYFDQLTAGSYILEFVSPTGFIPSPQDIGGDETLDSDIDPVTKRTALIALSTDEVNTGAGAGFFQPGSIGDRVFNDANDNGIHDAGEIGIPGVTVVLHDASGNNPLQTTNSGPDGQYLFANLNPGSYVVEFVRPSDFQTVPRNVGDDAFDSDYNPATGKTDPILVSAGESIDNLDAGFDPPRDFSQIGDRVWQDLNENGLQDPGEPGLDGVVVTLLWDVGDPIRDTQGNPVKTVTVNGAYNFVTRQNSWFLLEFDAGPFATPTLRDVGSDGTIDSDINPATGRSPWVQTGKSTIYTSIDAGYILADVGDTVWLDLDRDGIQDPKEPGLEGVLVELLNPDNSPALHPSGQPITDLTDSMGSYTLAGFPTGFYKARFTPPAGYLPSPQDATGDTLDSDIDANGLTASIDMSAGTSNRTVDAGFLPRGSAIGDFVFNDNNANGIQDAGETGVESLTVNLRDASGANVLATTTTNTAGSYFFDDLTAGSYILEFITPTGYTITSPNLGGDDNTDSDINPADGRTGTITIGTDSSDESVDAGFIQLGSIVDRVYLDINGDGWQHHTTDIGLPGVTVILHDGTGNNPLQTQQTPPDGSYSFTNLLPGNYVIEFVRPSDFTSSPQDAYNDVGDSDANPSTGKTNVITLNPGQSILDIAAGFSPPDEHSEIGDLVWEDSNANGIQDSGEPGVGGILVELLNASGAAWLDTAGNPVRTSTLPDGYYLFVLKPSTSYRLRFTPPTDAGFTTVGAGSDPDLDNDVSSSTNETATFAVGLDLEDFSIDAGISCPSVHGRLWSDNNLNGNPDSTETGIPNVAVYADLNGNLSRDAGEPFGLTDLSGNYGVAGLAPGSVTIRVDPTTLPLGTLLTADPDVLPDGATTVTLGAGQRLENQNFGYQGGVASLAGQVRSDFDADGDLDDSDSGVPAVTVRLYRDLTANGTYDPGTDLLVATTTTDSNGDYSFNTLLPGFYLIQETDPADTSSTNDTDGIALAPTGTDNIIAVVSLAGLNSTGHDFLDTAVGANTIRGFVINDQNGNGGIEAEPGIAGVKISLIVDPNNNGLADDGIADHATAFTDQNGAYEFVDVPNGNWVILATPPAGSTATNDATAPPADNTNSLNLNLGNQIWSNVNFLYTGVTLRRIVGLTFEDSDNDNAFTEADILTGGIPIELYADLNGNTVPDPGESLIATTTSNTDGYYEFPNLPSGQYVLVGPNAAPMKKAFDSDGDLTNDVYQIGVTLGQIDSTGNNFLVDIPSISGQVLNDTDADGQFNDPDEGVAGVTVRLFADTDGNESFDENIDTFIAVTSTNMTGHYAFGGVAAGEYIVVETDPPGTTSTNDKDFAPLEAEGMDNLLFVELVYNRKGRDFLDTGFTFGDISGQVRHDLDGDGDLSDPDQGLASLRVQLFSDPNADGNPTDGSLIGTTYTNTQGSYQFSSVIPGTYVVVASDSPGATSTNDKDNDPLGSQGTDNRVAVTLTTAGSTNNDFLDTGLEFRSILGRVLEDSDTNDNNVIGPEDIGVGGVEIRLYADENGNRRVDPNESYLGHTYTASDGSYTFENILDGLYVLLEIDPVFAVSEDDSDGDPTDSMVGVSLNGTDSAGNEFLDDPLLGYAVRGAVTDGNVPFGAIGLQLLASGNVLIETTYTDATGQYSFSNVVPGTYTVQEINPPGTTGGSDSDGGDPDRITVVLGSAPSTGNNFVDLGADVARISGMVLKDGMNNNNQIGPDDLPIAAVRINLIRTVNGEPDLTLASVHTSTDGRFRFPHLPAGTYLLQEINPTGATSDADSDGPANGNDTIAVNLSGGSDSSGHRFLDDALTTASITGTVLNDGVPLPGVLVSIINQTANLVDRAATNYQGEYAFPNLPSGTYEIQKEAPVGTTGGDDTPLVAFLNSSNLTAMNFANIIAQVDLYDLGGQVLNDANGNGVLGDSTDRPLDGVLITLYGDANNDGISQEVEKVGEIFSLTDGSFRFDGLPIGSYLIAETDPLGPGTSTADSGPDNGDPNLIPLDLSSTDSFGHDFLDTIVPGGYLYDTLTGEILLGGSVAVVPATFGEFELFQGGTNGYFGFSVSTPDTYTLAITPPAGYILDAQRITSGASLDPTGLPDPHLLGSIEDTANTGFLTDFSTSANPYYLAFNLSPNDPLVLTNNIPLRTPKARTFAQFAWDHALTGTNAYPVPNGTGTGGNPDGDPDSNLLEHALDQSAVSGLLSRPGFAAAVADPLTNRIDASFTRATGIYDVIYTLEGRDTLVGNGVDGLAWFTIETIQAGSDAGPGFNVVTNPDGTETVTFQDLASVPGLSLEAGLVRLRVDLDADQNGTPDTLPSDGTPATTYTKTLGWQTTVYNAGQIATFGSPFATQPIFGGRIDTFSGVSAGVLNSTGGVDLRNVVPDDSSHYLQVTSGPLEGERFDIANVGISQLILANDTNIFSDADGVSSLNTSSGLPNSTALIGASFVVRPHRTIDDLFDKNGGFAGQSSYDPNLAARLLIYNNRKDDPGFESLTLVDDSINIKWIYSWDLGLLENQGSLPFELFAGAYVQPLQGNLSLTAIGIVADHDLAAALRPGFNALGPPYPLDQSLAGPNGRGYTIADGIPGGIDPTLASNLFLWEGDAAVDSAISYTPLYRSYTLLDGGPGFQFWTDINDFLLPNLDLSFQLESHRAPFMQIPSWATPFTHRYPQPTP